jgi:TolB-like protein/Tfp pilus assembly protein PilF
MTAEGPESGEAPPPTDSSTAVQAPNGFSRVFVSYASRNAAVADALVEALERHGVACWIAPRDVKAGALYADAIVRAISDAKALVLVLSENSVASAHVSKEIERASSKRRPVIALRIDDAPLSPALEYFLGESHWVDARAGGMDAAVAKLVAAIREPERPAPGVIPTGLPGTSADRASAAHPKSRNRILLAAGLAVVAAALAALLADKFWVAKRVSAERPTATAPAAAPATPAIPEKSVAVLPFLDMSEKKDQEYFSDGLSEELIDLLTKIPDLRVPARTSSFYFKGKQVTVTDIAKALGVAHVLEGSVRKSGNHLRVTAQLVRADNGYHVWSETYDRTLDDIFKIQDEIAGAVVKALKVTLLAGKTLGTAPTSSTEAYTLYLQARAIATNALQPSDDKRAIEYLQRAIKIDPNFASAWAAMALDRTQETSYFQSGKDHEMMLSEARYAAEQALKLDPNLSEAHRAMSDILYAEFNAKAAEAEIHQAIVLDPGNAHAFNDASDIALTLRHFDEALQLGQRAVALDPLYAWNYGVVGDAYRASGRLVEAEAAYRKALDLAPRTSGLHVVLGWLLLERHEPAAALAEMDKEADDRYREVARALALDALGRKAEADRALAKAETSYPQVVGFFLAVVYANRNDPNSAFAWLNRAYQEHDGWLVWVTCEPLLENLRSDPRYKVLLSKTNLSQ